MNNIKAFLIMGVWTVTIGFILYSFEAHLHYREILWALSLSVILLATHMINMVIYFKVTRNNPYKWFNFVK
jgi:O-antigen/teichoic acid export membrane protein